MSGFGCVYLGYALILVHEEGLSWWNKVLVNYTVSHELHRYVEHLWRPDNLGIIHGLSSIRPNIPLDRKQLKLTASLVELEVRLLSLVVIQVLLGTHHKAMSFVLDSVLLRGVLDF